MFLSFLAFVIIVSFFYSFNIYWGSAMFYFIGRWVKKQQEQLNINKHFSSQQWLVIKKRALCRLESDATTAVATILLCCDWCKARETLKTMAAKLGSTLLHKKLRARNTNKHFQSQKWLVIKKSAMPIGERCYSCSCYDCSPVWLV